MYTNVIIDLFIFLLTIKISTGYQFSIKGKKSISFLFLMLFVSIGLMFFSFEVAKGKATIYSWGFFFILIGLLSFYYAKYPEKILLLFTNNLRKLISIVFLLKYLGLTLIFSPKFLGMSDTFSVIVAFITFYIGIYLYVIYRMVLLSIEAELLYEMGYSRFVASILWLMGTLGFGLLMFFLIKKLKSRLRDF